MSRQFVPKVIEWYSDITITSIALIICIILTIITFRAICMSKKSEHTLKVFTIQIYIVFISMIIYLFVNLLRIISLPIIGNNNTSQQLICDIENTTSLILFGINNLSIDALLITRLHTAFKNTQFELKKYIYYSYIIALSIYWFVWMINTGFMIINEHAKPYNVFTESVDMNGNGTTCLVTAAHSSKGLKIVLASAMIGLFLGNLIIWILFTRKLYHVLIISIQFTSIGITDNTTKTDKTNDSDKALSAEFIELMKDQTMLVGSMVFFNFFAYILTMIIAVGQLLVTINYINTLLTVFLSFKFNKYYFQLLCCDKYSKCCCKCFEHIITKNITKTNEMELAGNMPPKIETINNDMPPKNTKLEQSVPTQSPRSLNGDINESHPQLTSTMCK